MFLHAMDIHRSTLVTVPPTQPGCEVHGLPELSEFGIQPTTFDGRPKRRKTDGHLTYHIYMGVSENRGYAPPISTPQVLIIF